MAAGFVHTADPESARLAVLRSYAILDTEPEPALVELVQLVARTWQMPTAMLNLLDSQRCWFLATFGYDPAHPVRELPSHESFCNSSCHSSGTLVVPDAQADPRFAQLPIVNRDGGYRFYAGSPLITAEGHSLGTLCVLDRVPREPTPAQLAGLRKHAAEAMRMLDRRRERLAGLPSASGTAPDGRRAVLVVDDDEFIRQFVHEVLGQKGITALAAANGAEALALYRKHASEIGLVLTDINMPVMDGVELIRALRREPGHPAVAVMSGRLDFNLRDALTADGITCLLAKPFTIASLSKALALLPA